MTLSENDLLGIKGVVADEIKPLYRHIDEKMKEAKQSRHEEIESAVELHRATCPTKIQVDATVSKSEGAGWLLAKIAAAVGVIVSLAMSAYAAFHKS